MTIQCIGVSFRTASIELREHLSFDNQALSEAYARFREWRTALASPDAELVILSTCNRLELYLATRHEQTNTAADGLVDFCAGLCRVPVTQLEPLLYHHSQVDAVLHLCRVAAGLDSMVLGETQILGQVSDAYALAMHDQGAGPAMTAVFHAAIHAGKRAQTETTIGRNPASAGSVAVHLAEQVVGQANLLDAQVLVVGAGEMAELVIKALHARGIQHLAVANRTYAHAVALAQRWGGQALDLDQLEHSLEHADIIITSTGAPYPIVRHEQVLRAMRSRLNRPLVLVDIAVPRDVESAVRDIPGVRLYNLDDLQQHLEQSISERQLQVPLVEAIVDEEVQEFETWLLTNEVNPVISDLRKKAESIRQRELERAFRHLPDLDPRTREYIQGMTHALVNKLLHEPTSRLRAAAHAGHGIDYVESVRYLFNLNNDPAWRTPTPPQDEP